jgi:hypothetical protein
MEQSPTRTATSNAAAKPTWLVRRMRMLRLRRARGHATVSLPTREGPLRRGEPIARQPGRGLVVAVNLVVVPSRYTYSRPKAPTHGSTALVCFLGTVACAGNGAAAPIAHRPILRQPKPSYGTQLRLLPPIALVVRLGIRCSRPNAPVAHLPATLPRSSYCLSLL